MSTATVVPVPDVEDPKPCSSKSSEFKQPKPVSRLRGKTIDSTEDKLALSKSDSPHTVLRLKRRIDEDPAQVLLLSFKRAKPDEAWKPANAEPDDVVHRVLKLAGTVTPDHVSH